MAKLVVELLGYSLLNPENSDMVIISDTTIPVQSPGDTHKELMKHKSRSYKLYFKDHGVKGPMPATYTRDHAVKIVQTFGEDQGTCIVGIKNIADEVLIPTLLWKYNIDGFKDKLQEHWACKTSTLNLTTRTFGNFEISPFIWNTWCNDGLGPTYTNGKWIYHKLNETAVDHLRTMGVYFVRKVGTNVRISNQTIQHIMGYLPDPVEIML